MRSKHLYKDDITVVKCRFCHKPFFDREPAEEHAEECDGSQKHHVETEIEKGNGR